MKLESIAKTNKEVGLDSIAKILDQLETISQEDAQQLLVNAIRFKQGLQQQGFDSTNILQSQLDYWKQQLSGNLPTLELPTDRPRPPLQTFHVARQSVVLPKTLTQSLKDLSRQEKVTLFMTLLAAFQTLLYRYTGQEDILIGSPIANHNSIDSKESISCLVNILVMRAKLSGSLTFQELLVQVREVTLAAYVHQDVSFEKLVEELQLQDSSRNPLCQVMFALHNTLMPLESDSLPSSSVDINNGTSKFDLVLSMEDTQQGLVGVWEYNTDLFDATTIARMAGHFQTLLEGIVATPQQRVTELPLLNAAEHHQLLVEWNDTQAEYSQDLCIHQLFEASVERNPTAIAVVFENQQLTYQELNCQANQLAHHLKSLGVEPGTKVAVYMDRSLEIIPALLGILKAGGAYVPLETSFPKARSEWILNSLDIHIVVTQQSHIKTFEELQPQLAALEHLICLDATTVTETAKSLQIWQRSHLCQQPIENLPLQSSPDNTAYIIFTSGSTGTPKGVVVRHKPVINLIEWVNKTYSVNAADRILFITSLCFDLSVYDIFGLLAAGGSIRVVSSQDVRDPQALLHILCNEPITFWDSAPPALQQLVPFFPDVKSREGQQQLRLVFMSGDWIPVTLPDLIKATFSGVQVISLGGATEATVWSNFYPIEEVEPNWVSIPYGKPIQNAQYYILDSYGNPCPIGVTGELYIGGDCLACGYTDPVKTAERFIPNPFSQAPDARLYRTGDLARFFPDGNIQFLGRIDHQVKIRGFRIELGEIEATLSQHPAVRTCIVLAREEEQGFKYLVAYIEPGQGDVTTSELRSFIKEKLPEYMVPSAFVFLEALPITSNGKVDRRALPAPDFVKQSPENTYLAPQTPVEEMLALIWAQVLKIEQVGVQNNFFELGGHSLKATQLVSRIREAFQVELSVRQLFELPTIASLAQWIETHRRTEQNIQVPPIQPITYQEPILASFAQQRLWVLEQLSSGNGAYNIPIVLRILGPLNVAALEQSFNEIYKRHASLRTTFFTTKEQLLQVVSPPHPKSIPVVDLSNMSADERESVALQLAREAAQQQFDLVRGPLLLIKVVRLTEENNLLLLTMHHIISDGWSIGVVVRELASLYEPYSKGQPSPLTELAIQYTDFAHWQRQWLQSDVQKPQLKYWKQRLSGNLPALDLPTDRPRPAIQTFRGARQCVVLPDSLTQSLKRLSQQQGVTLFMTLLAAFQTLLYRYTGQEDILVGSPIANRNFVEIEELIGCFINTLVMRTNLSGNLTFEQLLAQVREVALEAYDHQDVPFEKLVEELQPERDTSRSPLFQVMFILQNAPMPALKMADLTLTPVDIDNGTSKFDLLLSMEDTQQGLVGVWEYNTDLFDATTITRMIGHFQTLLEGIVVEPQQQISQLPLLSATEQHQLFVEWNDTIAEYPQNVCIHQLFEASVERSPDKVAVVFKNQQLTYGELNQQANQLANYLKKCGVGTNVFVGICVERSLFMVVGLLGILKAGGTYVPLDPRYPKDRIAFVLEDTNAPVLLTQAALVASLPSSSAKVICLDTEWEIIAQEDKQNLQGEVNSEDLAYVIYTSGSTGKPKGVQIMHRAAVNFLSSMSVTPGLTAEDILLNVTTISFDIAALEIFLPLTIGATTIAISSEVASDGYALAEMLSNGATVMQATPATWRLLLETGWQGNANLKILCGGEALSRVLASALLQRAGSLWNMYGPTETTIWSSVYQVEQATESIPIGRPIANTQIYLLDSYGQPVPIGVPGELHIGGVGLAKGYLNRPELTAEKFIANPYSNQPGDRLYKTGDLARYLPDGNIECLGRIDNQVKIRGFRIELGEIETVLSRHSAVRENVVVGHLEPTGSKYLVAYVVAQTSLPQMTNQEQITTSELRSFLKEQLPEYMVPAVFVFLEALPLTPNGKVDRRALPKPELSRPELEKNFVAPQDPLELQLTKIWEEVLGIQPIGITDNFFDLGGHSLLAVRLFNEISKAFGINLPLTTLFQSPTIEQLANVLRSSGCDPVTQPLVPLKLGGDKPPLFCIYGILLYQELANNLDPEQPVYGVYLQEEVDLLQASRLEEVSTVISVTDLASRYLKEILTLQPQGPYFLAGESFGGLVAFEMAQQLHMQGEKVDLLALLDTDSPVNEEKLPLQKRVSLHLRNFLQAGFTYAFKKIRQKVSSKVEIDVRQQFRDRAFSNYVPRPYQGKIILFRAMERDQFEAFDADPRFGWGDLAAGGLEVHHVPGDHIGILKEPHVKVMAAKLQAYLE